MRTLIAANWKMNGNLNWAAKPLAFEGILAREKRLDIDILICPPHPFIVPLVKPAQTAGIYIGGQDCHANESGAHTGEVSAEMLKNVGATYVIVGHSERRAAGETSEMVKAKANAVHRAGLTPIICVGEALETREAGDAEKFVEDQLKASLPEAGQDVVIAYEPIWAIGTGRTANTDDIHDMHAHIRSLVGNKTRILYGGSVKPANAAEILQTPNVNGALIGGASLEMDSLAQIAKAV